MHPDHAAGMDALRLADGLEPLRLIRHGLGLPDTVQPQHAPDGRGVFQEAPAGDVLFDGGPAGIAPAGATGV